MTAWTAISAEPHKLCPRCKGEHDRPGQNYCRRCHNADQRARGKRQRANHKRLLEHERLRTRAGAYDCEG
jgi:hypothetical protein